MPVVTSSYVIDAHAQRDGSRWCREIFVLHDGRRITHERHIPANAQPDQTTFAAAKFAAHLADMPAILARNEAKGIVLGGLPLVLAEQTKEEFAEMFWQYVMNLYQDAQAGNDDARGLYDRAIWWLYQRIQAGDITSNQARLTFNSTFERTLTAGQWNTFVTDRLLPIVNRYQSSLDEAPL